MTAGDLGHLDSEGRLFVDSRADDMIVSGGENVYPGEIEVALTAHPDVDEVAAIGVDDEQFGQRVVAFVVPRPGSDPVTGEDLMAYVAERVAPCKRVRAVEFVDSIPKSPTGKLLRRVLIERERAAQVRA
jgi:fatty-acyl-CoA synthase